MRALIKEIRKKKVIKHRDGEKVRGPISRKTVSEVPLLLRLCFDAAVQREPIEENPAAGIKIKRELRNREPWDSLHVDQQSALRAAAPAVIPDDRDEPREREVDHVVDHLAGDDRDRLTLGDDDGGHRGVVRAGSVVVAGRDELAGVVHAELLGDGADQLSGATGDVGEAAASVTA